MGLFKPSELHTFLKSSGIQPKKGLSQNFLIDGNILKKMVGAAAIQPEDLILEIGPGPGVLTEALLQTGARVIAIEKDAALAQHLNRLQNGNLEVIHADFRDVSLESMLAREHVKVLANIPYHLTGMILQTLLPTYPTIQSIHLMVQKEVAERCTATINTKDYSSFTLFTQYHSDASLLFKVAPKCFYPPPKVDSAVLELKLKPPPVTTPYTSLFSVIRTAFHKRRKMLRASLKSLFPANHIENALQSIGKEPTARPQNLSLAEFATLTTCLIGDADNH